MYWNLYQVWPVSRLHTPRILWRKKSRLFDWDFNQLGNDVIENILWSRNSSFLQIIQNFFHEFSVSRMKALFVFLLFNVALNAIHMRSDLTTFLTSCRDPYLKIYEVWQDPSVVLYKVWQDPYLVLYEVWYENPLWVVLTFTWIFTPLLQRWPTKNIAPPRIETDL